MIESFALKDKSEAKLQQARNAVEYAIEYNETQAVEKYIQ